MDYQLEKLIKKAESKGIDISSCEKEFNVKKCIENLISKRKQEELIASGEKFHSEEEPKTLFDVILDDVEEDDNSSLNRL